MQVFENNISSPMPLGSDPIKITYDCPKKCGAHCNLKLGLPMGTYCKQYRGRLDYFFYINGEKHKGHWTTINDNTEVVIEHEGKCDGRFEIELCNKNGTLALWLTNKPTGLPVTSNGGPIMGRSCFSLLCTGGEKEVPLSNLSSLNVAGMVRTMNVHGGVRRYFELGNAFVEGGHKYSLFAGTLKEKTPWINFLGTQRQYGSWGSEKFDIAFTGAHECFGDLAKMDATRKVVLIVAKFYAQQYIELWKKHGRNLKWIGAASEWNKGMEEIEGVCIPGGVNTKFFTPQFNTGHRKPVVAFYARLGDGRGVERVISLAKSLEGVADFVGFDTPNYETLQYGLPSNVRIVMTPTQEALREVLQKADVVVSAMRSAGWNNVMAEGSACGCIPIAMPAGTKDIILHSRTGFMCSATWFEKEAAEYIRELAKDHDLMNRMSKRAHTWVQQFDWGIVAEKIINEVTK